MKAPAKWFSGIGISVGFHVGLAAFFVLATDPEPLDVEPQQSGRIRMEAYEVSETRAEAEDVSGQETEMENTDGATVIQGAVRSDRADALATAGRANKALATDQNVQSPLETGDNPQAGQELSSTASAAILPPSDAVTALESEETIIAAEQPSGAQTSALFALGAIVATGSSGGDAVQAVVADIQVSQPVNRAEVLKVSLTSEAAVTLASGTPPAALAKAAPLDTINLASADAAADTLAPSAPYAGPVPASSLISEETAQITPDAPAATPQAPPSVQVARQDTADQAFSLASAEPQAQAMMAVTGWAGGAGAVFDPVSLAAVQSFMQPLDADQAADSARDGISQLLSRVPCARLQATFIPESGMLELRGHVPEATMREPILNAIRAQLGASIPVGGSMLVLPSPQCDVLDRLENIGLPQSQGQRLDSLQIGATTQISEFDYGEGERVIIKMRSPDYPAYVYVDFFDVDGRVLHLRPNQWESVLLHDPDTPLEIGADREDGQSVHLIVRPPFGQELAIAYAASHPIYDGLRETIEPAGPYLDYMRTRIAITRGKNPDFRGEWVYMFVQTHSAD